MFQSIRKNLDRISRARFYNFSFEFLNSLFKTIESAIGMYLFGIPHLEGTPKEIAKKIIQKNYSKFLYFNGIIRAGFSHYIYEWLVDTAKAFKGIIKSKALPIEVLKLRVDTWIKESLKKGEVPTCFSHIRSFNMPFKFRADNLPWLIYAVDCLGEIKERAPQLKILLDNYLKKYFDFKRFLLKPETNKDWMDTILRPSSTYSNLCLLKALEIMSDYGYRDYADNLKESLLKNRWTGNYFIDYEGSGDWLSGDAAATALYFELFSPSIRNKIADALENSNLLNPIPLKLREGNYSDFLGPVASAKYHSLIWPHMGCMALNGFKALGRNYKNYLDAIENSIRKYGNFIEVFDEKGKPFRAFYFLHTSEWGLTMFAGQYLELID